MRIAEYISGKWICEGEEINPYTFPYRCLHEEKFYIAEDISELNNFLDSLLVVQPFDLRAWELSVVEPAVRLYIESVIRPLPLDYISIHEPNTWVNDTEFGAEALAVQAWIRDCWRAMKEQIEDLEAPIELEVIIQNLPELNLNA